MGIRVEWIGRVIGEISARNFELLREARLLRIQFEELQEEMDGVGQRLTKLDIKMSHMNFSPDSIENHEIQVEKEKSEIVMLYILFEWMINYSDSLFNFFFVPFRSSNTSSSGMN